MLFSIVPSLCVTGVLHLYNAFEHTRLLSQYSFYYFVCCCIHLISNTQFLLSRWNERIRLTSRGLCKSDSSISFTWLMLHWLCNDLSLINSATVQGHLSFWKSHIMISFFLIRPGEPPGKIFLNDSSSKSTSKLSLLLQHN